MRVIVQSDYKKVSKWTAGYVAGAINSFKPQPGKPLVLGLPTGSSPLGMYKELIRLYESGRISFANVVTFNMDEYVGLSSDHTQSYSYYMLQNFFNHMWTVSCLQLHPHCTIVCDDAAPVEMKVGTVNYFKEIEKENLSPDDL